MDYHKKKFAELLQVYLLQLQEEVNVANEKLIQLKPNLKNDTIFNIGTWVWLYQKQITINCENKELMEINTQPYINFLCSEWINKHPWIWDNNHQDVFLSNLGIVYGALLETKNAQKIYSLQKTMTEIRDYVFDNLLTGGTVISGKYHRQVSIDQILAVIPFGMFSPEDLIIVEATQKMEMQLKTEDGFIPYQGVKSDFAETTAMIALYFLEKSDLKKAKYYSDLVNRIPMHNELSLVLIRLFDHFNQVNLKQSEIIIHEPLGNENVYEKKITERIPHFPTLIDYLQLSCQVITEESIDNVYVIIENINKSWQRKELLVPKINENILIYEKMIPPLPHHGKYTYYFEAELANGKKLISEEFNLTTLTVRKLEKLELIDQSAQKLLFSIPNGQKKLGLQLEFKQNNLQLTLLKDFDAETNMSNKVDKVSIKSGPYWLKVQTTNPHFEIYKGNQRILETHPLQSPIEWKVDAEENILEFTIHWKSPEDEKFYGFGERYNRLDQRGELIDCFVYNQYRDQGTRTYMPIPFYLTNRGYACFIDTQNYTKFDLAKELKDKCSVSVEQTPSNQESNIYLFFGDYKEQISSYIKLTGKPKMVPSWALGPWMSSNNWDRESIVRKEIETTMTLKIPATVIVLEQWSDETTYYMFNDAEYELKHPSKSYKYEEIRFPKWGRWPDPKGMIKYIHDNNLKLLLWQIPIQKYLNKQAHPLKDLDEAYMIEKGYVVKNPDGSPYRIPENWFTGSLLMDFSNEEGKNWWFNKRQYLIDIGVDGFKTDGGEFVFGKKLKFANGKTGSEMRNQYPNDYVSAYYDFAQQNQGMTFSRAGYIGAQNFPAHWAGDERSTFDAFRRSLIAGLNAGLSGIVFWGWDLAGFNGDIPTDELYMRSTAMAAFCPIMQYHAESKGEFNQDRTPWNIADRTNNKMVIDVYRFFANLRMNLIPYIYEQAYKSSQTGLPLMRALLLEYPDDPRVQGIYDEYLFGDSILVAPIIEEAKRTRKVYLPEGTWFNFWTNKKISGPTFITVSAPLDRIPIFIKANVGLLFNLDETKELGSWVGNHVNAYNTPVCKVYYHKDFSQTITDHLGNTINLSIYQEHDEIVIEMDSSFKDLEIDVIGTNKKVKILKDNK